MISIYATIKAGTLSATSLEVFLTLPLKQFYCSALSMKIVERFPSLRLSPPGHRWCGVPAFVPAGCVSSHMCWLYSARQSICSVMSQFPTGENSSSTINLWYDTPTATPRWYKYPVSNSLLGEIFLVNHSLLK